MLTPPFHAQQATALRVDALRATFALFMEQGTGKTWVGLAVAERLFALGEIEVLMVVALNGVHSNWIDREIPAHLSPPYKTLTWEAGCDRKKWWQQELALWEQPMLPATGLCGLRIVAFNVEAFSQSHGAAAELAQRLLEQYKCLMIVDESDTIASPSAQRTKTLWRLGKRAFFRRIFTGTPLDESPLDAYSQFKFLDLGLLGFQNYAAFKAHFGEWVERRNAHTGHSYPVMTRYRNLDQLKSLIDANSYTVRKKDCLDLPEKVYQVRPVVLPEPHMKLYRAAVKELVLELETGRLTLAHALTRTVRLAQIAGGFEPHDDGTLLPIAAHNPKVESLLSYLRDLPKDVKVIVWCRFVAECEAVVTALGDWAAHQYDDLPYAVSYWGEIPDKQREDAIDLFQNGFSNARYFVGTPSSGGRGITLTAATQVIYFSNDFSLRDRSQSEDRAHRIGQRNAVTYTDLVARGTIDEKILKVLQEKRTLRDLFADDDPRALIKWLEAQ